MFREPRRFGADLDDPRRRVAYALATFTIEDLRQLVTEIEEASVGLIGVFEHSVLSKSGANDNQPAWPYIAFPAD